MLNLANQPHSPWGSPCSPSLSAATRRLPYDDSQFARGVLLVLLCKEEVVQASVDGLNDASADDGTLLVRETSKVVLERLEAGGLPVGGEQGIGVVDRRVAELGDDECAELVQRIRHRDILRRSTHAQRGSTNAATLATGAGVRAGTRFDRVTDVTISPTEGSIQLRIDWG